MSKTVLLTGARAPVALDLARLLHAAGHRVVVAESVPRHLGEASRAVARSYAVPAPNADHEGFVAGLLDVARRERVDVLLPTCEEVFHVAAGREALEAACEVFAPPLAQLLRLHSKLDFIRGLEARGVAVPETWELRSVDELRALWDGLPAGRKLVLKPVFSRFAVDVAIGTTGGPMPDVVPTPERPWVAQAFIAGEARCTYGVARDGVLLAHAAYDAEFTAGRGASVSFRHLDHPGLLAWVRAFVAAERLTGQVSFDFIEAADGTLYPLECNPRATSGVHLFTAADGLDRALLGASSLLPGGGEGGRRPDEGARGAPKETPSPGFPASPRTHPGRGDCIQPDPANTAVLGLAMWLYALPSLRTPDRLLTWATRMATARDAVFRWDDPLPAASQLGVFAHFVAEGLRHGTSALAASTRDIEWNHQP